MACYWPSGKLQPGDVPCSPDYLNKGLCCPEGWSCYSNSVCYNPAEGSHVAPTCMDNVWNGSHCPNPCEYDDTQRGITICDAAGPDWCCEYQAANGDCCSGPHSLYFHVAVGSQVAVATVSTSSSASSASSTTTSTTDASSTSTATLTTQAVDPAGHSSLITTTIVSIVSGKPSSTSSGFGAAPNAASQASVSGRSSVPVILGVCIGVGSALLLGFFLFRHLARQRKIQHLFVRPLGPWDPSEKPEQSSIPPPANAHEADSYPVAGTNDPDGNGAELESIHSAHSSPNLRRSVGRPSLLSGQPITSFQVFRQDVAPAELAASEAILPKETAGKGGSEPVEGEPARAGVDGTDGVERNSGAADQAQTAEPETGHETAREQPASNSGGAPLTAGEYAAAPEAAIDEQTWMAPSRPASKALDSPEAGQDHRANKGIEKPGEQTEADPLYDTKTAPGLGIQLGDAGDDGHGRAAGPSGEAGEDAGAAGSSVSAGGQESGEEKADTAQVGTRHQKMESRASVMSLLSDAGSVSGRRRSF